MRTLLFSAASLTALALAIGGCSMGAHPTTLNVPMTYTPTSHINFPSNLSTAGKVYVAPVVDQRQDKTSVGQNIEDEGKPARPVLADSEAVTRFVRDAFARELATSGVAVGDAAAGADRTLTITLRRLYCTEDNTYRTDANATVDITGRGATFNGTYAGQNTRFGRSYSIGNYQESYSDAMVDLMDKMFADPRFRAAMGLQ